MFPVYGLAEASLAVTFPDVGAPMRTITLNRHRLNVGSPVELVAKSDKDAVELISEGKVIPYCQVRVTDDEDKPLPEDRIGNVQMTGDNVTRGYFENPEANAAAFSADGWLRTGDLGLFHQGELFISGRAKEIIFVTVRTTIRTISRRSRSTLTGSSSARWLQRVCGRPIRRPSNSWCSSFTAVGWRTSCRSLRGLPRLINEQTGLEVGAVIPVKRIPKTTSGKIQRHLLEESFLAGEFDTELQELAALREAERGGAPEAGSLSDIENKLKTIVDTAMQGKRVGVNDNLFEVGASSLKLIEIHERIDHDYPGMIDLTELFDFPTIAELARHLQGKLGMPG